MNTQEKFMRWQEKMKGKSEQEKHNYAITISLGLGAVIAFFLISNWYYTLWGGTNTASLFSGFENLYVGQKETLLKIFK